MSQEDRGAEKVLLGKFLIGAEIFFRFDNFVFFLGESSNGTALLCVVLSNWEDEDLYNGVFMR